MLVKVRGPRGVITVEVDFIEKISDLKLKIHDKSSHPIEKQILLYQGHQLEDNRCLEDYRITHESELELQLRLKINIKTSHMPQFSIECAPTSRIIDLKDEISRKTNIPAKHQVLSYKDFELTNEQLLSECRIADDSILLLSGVTQVTVNLPSGKSITYPTALRTSIFEVKTVVSINERISTSQQKFNYNGRELKDDQTLQSIYYTNSDCINLVVKLLPSDDTYIIVNNINGDRHLVRINRLNPVGSIVDTIGAQNNSVSLYFKGERLQDENVLNYYEHIRLLSELVLAPCGDTVPVVITTINGDVETFFLNPDEDIDQLKSRIRDYFGLPQEHLKLFHKHSVLKREGAVGSFEIATGDQLLFGPDESTKVTVLPPSRPIEILALPHDEIVTLKQRIFRKEKIPIELQELSFQGNLLEDRAIFGDISNDPSISNFNLFLSIRSSETIKVKIRDLEGNWFNISKVDQFWTVNKLVLNLQRILPLQEEDLFVCRHLLVVMDQDRLLCSYGIADCPEIWIVSQRPNLVSERSAVQSLPVSPNYSTSYGDQSAQHSNAPFPSRGSNNNLRSEPDNCSRAQKFHTQHSEPKYDSKYDGFYEQRHGSWDASSRDTTRHIDQQQQQKLVATQQEYLYQQDSLLQHSTYQQEQEIMPQKYPYQQDIQQPLYQQDIQQPLYQQGKDIMPPKYSYQQDSQQQLPCQQLTPVVLDKDPDKSDPPYQNVTANSSLLNIAGLSLGTRRDYFGQAVSSDTSSDIPSPMIHPQAKYNVKDTSFEHYDVTMPIKQKYEGQMSVLCSVERQQNHFMVSMNDSDLVSELASKISLRLSVPEDNFILKYYGEVLESQRTLSSYYLQEISTVNIELI